MYAKVCNLYYFRKKWQFSQLMEILILYMYKSAIFRHFELSYAHLWSNLQWKLGEPTYAIECSPHENTMISMVASPKTLILSTSSHNSVNFWPKIIRWYQTDDIKYLRSYIATNAYCKCLLSSFDLESYYFPIQRTPYSLLFLQQNIWRALVNFYKQIKNSPMNIHSFLFQNW